jgi:hypothetical protein
MGIHSAHSVRRLYIESTNDVFINDVFSHVTYRDKRRHEAKVFSLGMALATAERGGADAAFREVRRTLKGRGAVEVRVVMLVIAEDARPRTRRLSPFHS